MSAVDIYLGIIKPKDRVWAHHGQFNKRVEATFLAETDDGYRCQLEDGRRMNFKFIRWMKK